MSQGFFFVAQLLFQSGKIPSFTMLKLTKIHFFHMLRIFREALAAPVLQSFVCGPLSPKSSPRNKDGKLSKNESQKKKIMNLNQKKNALFPKKRTKGLLTKLLKKCV